MEDHIFSDVKWMPCLGRKFRLGDLYDCCTDTRIIGSSIWNEKAIHGAKIENAGNISPIEYTSYVLQNIEIKVKCLGIDGELYLSCAAGNVKLDGEAKFFNDEVASKNIVQVALKCYSSSKIVQLKKSILQSENIITFEQDGATDVITGIEYGAISIVVCCQKLQDKHAYKSAAYKSAAYESLQTKIKYLQNCISGKHNETFSSLENHSENITCRIFTTFDHPHKLDTMYSYTDAVGICKDLFKLHVDTSTHVPVNVSLFPLKKINSLFTKFMKHIYQRNLIADVKKLHGIINNMSLLLKELQAIAEHTLPCISEKIEFYNIVNMNPQSQFSEMLGCLVPKYRKGQIKESELKEEIDALFEKSKAQYTLLKSKLKEIQQILAIVKDVEGYELIIIDSSILIKNNYVICLEINTDHLINFKLSINKPWYQDEKVIAEVAYKIEQFVKFAEENSNAKHTKFGVVEFSDQTCKELVVIKIYFDEKVLLFEPPTMPGKPKKSQITDSAIALTWSEPQQGAQFIISYHICYRKIDRDKWNSHPIKIRNNNSTIIENLEANTGYIFKVCAKLIIHCITIESPDSEIIYTSLSAGGDINKRNSGTKLTKLDTTAHNHGKVTAKTINPKENIRKYESETVPQEMAKYCSQDSTRKFSGKGTHAQKSIQNVVPKSPTIKAFWDANKCEQLKAGNPSLYKLLVTKDPVQLMDIKIHNFGGKHDQFPEKVILLVGATGAGKTTLINGIVNYIFGVEWENPERVVLTEHSSNKSGASQAESETKFVEVYKISHGKYYQLSYNLTIIDTPGFEDPDGLKTDQNILTQIQALLTSDKIVNHIDAIGFVVQAPLGRLTPTQSYVIRSVYSLFGNDVANNIFILVTFTDNLSPPPILHALAEAKIQYNKCLKFNNSALYANIDKTDKNYALNKTLWEIGMKSFSKFFRELEKINPVPLALTKKSLNERNRLQNLVEGLQQKIKCEFLNMQKLECEEEALINYKNEGKKDENFQYNEYTFLPELTPLESKEQLATNCSQCKITCHKLCLESRDRRRCNMMIQKRHQEYICSVCHCSINSHETSNSYYHIYSGTESKTIKDIKQKYNEQQFVQINIQRVRTKITEELEKLHRIVHNILLEMHKCTQCINEFSMQPNKITEIDYISTLIDSENADQTEGYKSRIKFYQRILKELQNNNKAPGIEAHVSQV